MSQPVIKYTLTKQGRQPEWLSSDSRAFKGQHSTSANKAGKLPRFGAPQDTIYLGIGAGDADSDGTPDGYVGTIASKADLQTYVTEVGTAADYHVVTLTVTGIQTSVTTGLSTAWDAINSEQGYQGGLSTTTSSKHTASGVGTVMVLTGSQVIKVVTETNNGSGITTSTVDTPVVVDPASTKSNVSTSVGIVTTTSNNDPGDVGVTTTVTTTTTESYSYTDVRTSTSTSKSETTTDGVTTRTDTVTTTETTKFRTSYDYAAEATRLWDIYEAINS